MRHILFILFLSFFTYQGNSQGKLEKAEKSLSKKEGGSSSQSRYNNSSSDSENSFVADTFGELFVSIFWGITYGLVFETPIEKEHLANDASITKYPYYNKTKGNYSYEWGDDTEVFRTTISNRFIAENGKLYGNHLNGEIWFLKRISLEGDYLQLWEENTNFGDNSLAMYTALAKYHRVRTERFNAWWGIGAAYVDGEVDELGFTYGLGAELFFAKPLSVEAVFNQTFINNRTVNKFTGSLNYHVDRYKISGGYEHLKIGNQDFSMFSIGVGISF
ncbi:hypothetical protein [uncultured Aquimarina sp.]|uniref:hypothetical protein n=1 Tax=uncultured Aquimarina sp. TaxID=575652 RepID=UPI002616D2EE|nr:hypothetical protein [uncultured Aquimarina sp.]